MTFTGTIQNGVVVLPAGVVLAEGTEVEVTPRVDVTAEIEFGELADRLAKPRAHLPPDYALNHRRYVRGEPRK